MDVYMYQGDILCEACATRIAGRLGRRPQDDDPDVYPSGPYPDGGGEADYPVHCGVCGLFLKNPLTADGVEYVRQAVHEDSMAGRTDSVACTVWAEFYAVESFDRMPDPTARIATNEREDMNASLSITLADYQADARRTARYPGHGLQGLSYTALGLAGEAGEVANKVKKVIRDDRATLTDEARNAIADELGDVLWYAAMLAHELGVSLEAVAARNLAKLRDRAERGAIGGSGDAR